jgi:hypothetical protein
MNKRKKSQKKKKKRKTWVEVGSTLDFPLAIAGLLVPAPVVIFG